MVVPAKMQTILVLVGDLVAPAMSRTLLQHSRLSLVECQAKVEDLEAEEELELTVVAEEAATQAVEEEEEEEVEVAISAKRASSRNEVSVAWEMAGCTSANSRTTVTKRKTRRDP